MMGKTELDRCVDDLAQARDRWLVTECDGDGDGQTIGTLLKAVRHLANYCRERVADHPALTPVMLHSTIENLLARIEALENPRNPLYARAGAVAEDEPAEACPADWAWLMTDIQADCKKRGWTDVDVSVAWMMGRDALLRARSLGARFPHD